MSTQYPDYLKDLCDRLQFRVSDLEHAIKEVVTQQGDNLCWMDAYQKLARLVGVDFDPTLLDEGEMLANCKRFVRSLKAGCPYVKTGYKGTISKVSLLHLTCGHCDATWIVRGKESVGLLLFCPYCGKQQQFDQGPPT
jgi:hypothetical protein